jgi:UDP-N-acetylmuramate--alanine ligase
MHIYFSGIGGAGIGPLAQIAAQAGYEVSGSDKQPSAYIDYLRHHGISDIHIGQSVEAIREVDAQSPIDWLVYSSAVVLENSSHPELQYCHDKGIRVSKRDELLSQIISDKGLEMIAIAGTHGKTTTTAMVTWLFKQLHHPISHILPAKTNFTDMGEFNPGSKLFVYEADEFDRNFLAYEPKVSVITGVSWDHHEIFPTREDYQDAFREFISQTDTTFIWQEDLDYLGLNANESVIVLDSGDPELNKLKLLAGSSSC